MIIIFKRYYIINIEVNYGEGENMIKNIFKMKCPNCKAIFIDEGVIYGHKSARCPKCNCSLKTSNLYITGEIFIAFLGAFLGGEISDKIISGNTGSEKFISALIVGCTVGLVLFIYTAIYPKKLSIKNTKDKY